MEQSEFLDNFQRILEDGLVKVCKGMDMEIDDIFLSEDIESAWDKYIKGYTGDAVENYNDYPDAAMSWAAFLGMAVAHRWDENWASHKDDAYESYYGSKGWDDMDERICDDILGLGKDESAKIYEVLSSCAAAAQGLIRHEQIEAQTAVGFYVLVRCYTAMYRLGAAMELKRLGYKKVKLA